MVKKKANVHIEDWLGERASPSLTANGPTVPVPSPISVPASPPVAPNVSASEVTAGSEPAEPVAPTGDDMATNHKEAAEWLWGLLAEAGYELW